MSMVFIYILAVAIMMMLMAVDPLYGQRVSTLAEEMSQAFAGGDAVRGNALLATVLDRQTLDLPEEDGRRGNFRRNNDDPVPIDLNDLSFCGPHLGYVFMEHGDKLNADNFRRMKEIALPECLRGYDHHYCAVGSGIAGGPQPRWWQTNVWFLNIAGRVMIARALDRQDHIAIARDHLEQTCRYVQLYNNGEYNSPGYMVSQIQAIHWAWYYAPDEVFRGLARQLLDKLYLDLAEYYHSPSETLGGTWSRHYQNFGRGYRKLVAWAFEQSEPSLLESLGLQDYRCPPKLRDIALHKADYSVWQKNLGRISRMTYHTADYSLATQTGSYQFCQQDTWAALSYVTSSPEDRRLAVIRTPYWAQDPPAAARYALAFRRYAHQYENRAILSFGHGDYYDLDKFYSVPAGNDILFSLAPVSELSPVLVDAAGKEIGIPVCPMMPAPPAYEKQPVYRSVHITNASPFTYAEPLDREPPGAAVNGPIIAELPSCYLAVIPAGNLTLRVAEMNDEVYIVIPVRPAAVLALYVQGKSECDSLDTFLRRCAEMSLEITPLANVNVGVRLTGQGPKLTAGYIPDGRLFDRRIDDLKPEYEEYACYSPWQRRRDRDSLEIRPGDDPDDKRRAAALCNCSSK